MSLVFIRQKARDLHAKVRRQRLATSTVPVIVSFFYGFSIKQLSGLQYLLHLLFATALAWSFAGLFFLNRGQRSQALPADAGFSTGLEFCRREIQRQSDYFHRDLLWAFAPILVAIATFFVALAEIAGPRILPGAVPLISLVILWIAAYLFIRVRHQKHLQRELEDLVEIERENSR